MGQVGTTQLIIILVIVILLFGAKKIPELAKGIGSGIKNFKKEMNTDDDKKEDTKIVENKTETTISKPEEKKEA